MCVGPGSELFGRWGGACYEVNTEASSDAGDDGASGCDSVSLVLGAVDEVRFGEVDSVHYKETQRDYGKEHLAHGEVGVVGSQEESGVATIKVSIHGYSPGQHHGFFARVENEGRDGDDSEDCMKAQCGLGLERTMHESVGFVGSQEEVVNGSLGYSPSQ